MAESIRPCACGCGRDISHKSAKATTYNSTCRVRLSHARRPYVPCSVDGCEKTVYSRQWCEMHYWRWKRHRDPTVVKSAPVPTQTKPDRDAVWANIQRHWNAGMPGKDIAAMTDRTWQAVRTDMVHMRRAGVMLYAANDPRRFVAVRAA